jgi:hypothetical protein
MRAARELVVLLAVALSGCTLMLDPDDQYRCDGPAQCAAGYRCIEGLCRESGPVCGDYDVDAGEECDDGAENDGACPYGQQQSCTACTAECRRVSGIVSYCGDGAIDTVHDESCDEGLANSDAPDATCRTDCTPRRCGDGIVDGGEACDADTSNVASCPAWVTVPPSAGFCTTACQPLSCPSVAFCGDGVLHVEWETCDAGPKNGTCGGACGTDCAPRVCDREWVQWCPPGDALPDAIYDTSTAGIVRDTVSDLTWQRGRVDVGTYSWAEARSYCSNLTLAGFTDWRLPTLAELESLVDYSRSSPAINATAFPGTEPSLPEYYVWGYWSSSIWQGESTKYWAVDFANGAPSYVSDFRGYAVRCVR